MEKIATLDVSPKMDTEYESAIDQCLGGMKLLQEQMQNDQREIETLRSETDAILGDIMHTLKAA